VVESEFVFVGLFVLELVNVSPDDDADIEMEEKTNDVDDDEPDLPTSAENRAASNFLAVAIDALDQRALGEDEVERECSQTQRGEEAHPNEDGVSLNHTTVSDYRANESKERDESDESEDDTSDDKTNPSSRCDCHLVVFQDVRSCVDGVYKPEKCTSTESAADEGEKRGDENGGPDGDAATEVSTGAHGVVVVKTRFFVRGG